MTDILPEMKKNYVSWTDFMGGEFDIPDDEQEDRLIQNPNSIHIGEVIAFRSVEESLIPYLINDVLKPRNAVRGRDYLITMINPFSEEELSRYWYVSQIVLHVDKSYLTFEDIPVNFGKA